MNDTGLEIPQDYNVIITNFDLETRLTKISEYNPNLDPNQ